VSAGLQCPGCRIFSEGCSWPSATGSARTKDPAATDQTSISRTKGCTTDGKATIHNGSLELEATIVENQRCGVPAWQARVSGV